MIKKVRDNYAVLALYKFVSIPDIEVIRGPLLARCKELNIRGTLLLATEGINGTVCGTASEIDLLIAHLQSDRLFTNLEYKKSFTEAIPFHRMKVKLKKEIVTMGLEGIHPAIQTGTYVEPAEWNTLISDPEVLLIDTRNDYETEIGQFENATIPHSESFTEFPDYVENNLDADRHKKIAMYCTGGIRCEKASAYLLSRGFKEVYQLHGGILKYLEETGTEESLWQGECFVFDGRVAVNEELQQGQYEQCFGCRRPVSEEGRQSGKYEYGISCPACHGDLTEDKRARLKERQKQVELAEQRDQQHIGADMDLKGKRVSD